MEINVFGKFENFFGPIIIDTGYLYEKKGSFSKNCLSKTSSQEFVLKT